MANVFIESYIRHDDGTIEITDESVHYISNVLRLRAGDYITLFTYKGEYMGGEIVSIYKNHAIIAAQSLTPPDTESSLDITLFQGLLKGEKLELVIQKATELGVKKIVPIITERSVPSFTRKIDRLQKIAGQACRQSGRVKIPNISEPVNFRDSIKRHTGHGIIFYEGAGTRIPSFEPSIDKIDIYIGPEGGFSEGEVRLAESKGLIVTTLGKRILRAETAAITGVSLIQYLFGDLN